jgi:hypothetical protein
MMPHGDSVDIITCLPASHHPCDDQEVYHEPANGLN